MCLCGYKTLYALWGSNKNLTHFFWKFRKKNNPLRHNISLGMKEKTKQLKAEISKSLSAISEIGDRVEKKSISKKISALAEDLRKLFKKEAAKQEKKAAKAEKKAAKKAKEVAKKAKEPQAKKVKAPESPAKKEVSAPSEAKKQAPEAAEPVKNLKAEVWNGSSKE